MRESNWIKLCDFSVLADRSGKPYLDEKGNIKVLNAEPGGAIEIKFVSNQNPKNNKLEYSLYISTLMWRMLGIQKFISGKEQE